MIGKGVRSTLAAFAALAIGGFPAPCETVDAVAPAAEAPIAAPAAALPPGGRVENQERDGIVVSRSIYDAAGSLLEESFFTADGLSERREYIRGEGRLLRIEAADVSGKLVGSIEYRYDGRGRLIGLKPMGSLGSGSIGMLASGASPEGSWYGSGDSITVLLLDVEGRPLREEKLVGGTSISRRSFVYGEDGFIEHSEETDLASDESMVSDFDDKGRLLVKAEKLKGILRSRTEYRYNPEGKLVEERSRSKLSLVLRSFAYDEAGALAREETRIDGLLSGAIEYRGDIKILERYHEGSLFVRSSYSSGRKIKDEFFDEGLVTRTKEYQ